MTIQDFVKTLKTVKGPLPSPPSPSLSPAFALSSSYTNETRETLLKALRKIPTSTSATQENNATSPALSTHKLHSFLGDPTNRTSDCLQAFNFLLRNHSELSFKPDLHAHLTLVCRLIKAKSFSCAEIILENAAFDKNYRYQLSEFTRWVENYCNESRIITKMLNMLFKVYSDRKMFDEVSSVFEFMLEKGFERDERSCSVHLLVLMQANEIGLAFDFFHRMVSSGMEVSVYSLTIMVKGLCKVGELQKARELVEDMSPRGTKPNIITLNTMVDACVKRCNLSELDLVLCLIKKERIPFNDTTFKVLVEGYSASGKVEEAEKLLLEMRDKDMDEDSYLYYLVIRGYCRLGNVSSAWLVFRKMQERGVLPSSDIYCCLMSGLFKVGEIDRVKELVLEIYSKSSELDNDMVNTLVEGYSKCGMTDELLELKLVLKRGCNFNNECLEIFEDSESEIELIDYDVKEKQIMDVDVTLGSYLSSQEAANKEDLPMENSNQAV